MFGKMEAFGGTVEEQNRCTLHIHLLVWVVGFNCMRDNMFSEDHYIKERARKCMIDYCSKIMTASYPNLDLTHTVSDESSESCLGRLIPVTDQKIRNLQHKSKCVEAGGVIAKCNTCDRSFTTVQIVNNSLNNWKVKLEKEKTYNFWYPVSRERSYV